MSSTKGAIKSSSLSLSSAGNDDDRSRTIVLGHAGYVHVGTATHLHRRTVDTYIDEYDRMKGTKGEVQELLTRNTSNIKSLQQCTTNIDKTRGEYSATTIGNQPSDTTSSTQTVRIIYRNATGTRIDATDEISQRSIHNRLLDGLKSQNRHRRRRKCGNKITITGAKNDTNNNNNNNSSDRRIDIGQSTNEETSSGIFLDGEYEVADIIQAWPKKGFGTPKVGK
jgi:hypothetical protein